MPSAQRATSLNSLTGTYALSVSGQAFCSAHVRQGGIR
jgi:hypothetical protein